MIRMNVMDAGWFHAEKADAPAHFGPLIILSPPPGAGPDFVTGLVAQWRQCRSFRPPFNYLLSQRGWPSWRVLADEDIDLDYHFRHSALPAPGGERELGELVSRLQSHPLDRRRPLWECHVIEGLAHGRFAIYLKLHHGQLDGMGTSRLLARVFSEDASAQDGMPPWYVGMSSRPRSDSDSTRRPAPAAGWFSGLRTFWQAWRVLRALKRDAGSGRHPELAVPFQAPRTLLNGRIGPQRRFATQYYALDRLQRVARAGGVSINDVFLAISGGALRRYLGELDALPRASLVGQVPVSVRPAGDASVGNAITFLYARLHTDLADPVARLQAVRTAMQAGKSWHERLTTPATAVFTLLLLGPYMLQIMLGLGGYLRPSANLVISNVKGPRRRIYFNGARVEHAYGPSVLFHGQALNITLCSYADEINIGYTGCQRSLPSLQRLAVYTGEELEALERALGLARAGAEAADAPDEHRTAGA